MSLRAGGSTLQRICAFALALLTSLLFFSSSAADVQELLTNPGFEDGVGGWSWNHAAPVPVAAPVHGGSAAVRLPGLAAYPNRVYQWIDVQPGQPYELAGWVWLNDPAVYNLTLEASWYDSVGNLLGQSVSPALANAAASYRSLTTGAVTSPSSARRARVGMIASASADFDLFLDDFSFSGPPAGPFPSPTARPSGSPTAAPTPTPSPAPTGRATPSPRTPGATPTSTPIIPPAATPAAEPGVFPLLQNGGFEQLRTDGTPFAWRKVGGEIQSATQPRTEGARSLALMSASDSTKWAFQAVQVRERQNYRVEVMGMLAEGSQGDVFVRVSWYPTDDASGPLIKSQDSTEVIRVPTSAFRLLSAGPLYAPDGARSAAVRLMLRPNGAAQATAYFDAVQFAVSAATQQSARSGAAAAGSPADGADAAEPAVSAPAVLGVGTGPGEQPRTPVNAKPVHGAQGTQEPRRQSNGNAWLVPAALALPLAAIAGAGGYQVFRRRRRKPGGPP